MTSIEIEQFRAQLMVLRAELEAIAEISAKSTDTVVLDQTSVGRLSRMDAMQQQQMARETEHRRQQQLIQITAALKRIEADEFGECYICGEDINPRRLAVDPTNTRCIACAENA